jgi:hypothetical protein
MDLDVPEFLILVLAIFAVVYVGIHVRGRRRKRD